MGDQECRNAPLGFIGTVTNIELKRAKMNTQRLPTKRNPSTDQLLQKEVLADRLLEVLAERDQQLQQQLTLLNKNILLLLESVRLQGSGVSQHLQKISANQDTLIDVDRQLLSVTRAQFTGHSEPQKPLPFSSLVNLPPTSPTCNISQRDKYALEQKFELQRRGRVEPTVATKPSSSKEGENDEYQASQEKAALLPSRFALIPFEEKEIIVDVSKAFENASKVGLNITTAQGAISKWLAEVFDSLCRESFSGYFSRHLSEGDAKVYFTHNLALNFEHMT